MNRKPVFAFIAMASLLYCCTASEDALPLNSPDPILETFAPGQGLMTQTVTISGKNFSPILLDNVVQFNGVPAFLQSASPESLTVTVPDSATTGKIQVTVAGRAAISEDVFTVLSPQIESIVPMIGSPGLIVTIDGENFLPDPAHDHVYFGAIRADVRAATSTQLGVKVPAAASSGKISITIGTEKTFSEEDFYYCDGMAELIINDVVILSTNAEKTQFTFSCKLTNVGNAALDLSKMVMQNYVSSDEDYDGSDDPAGGWILDAGGILQQGESYETNWSANADYSSKPNLIITVYVKEGQSINECSSENNIASKSVE